MKVIGLTGGIGSGKSTVSKYLLHKGYPVIDADKIAHEIVEPGSGTLVQIVRCFGSTILNADGSLNRKALAAIIFTQEAEKKKLDDIMKDEILRIIETRVADCEDTGSTVIFIDAPLLFETGLDKKTNETWVVDACDPIRINRIVKRDGISSEAVLARIRNQMSRQEKNSRASYVIDNSTTEDALYKQIEILLNKEKKTW